jgi:hypothetical protein
MEPLTNRGVLLNTLLQDILNPSHHLPNVFLQIANKLGIKKNMHVNTDGTNKHRNPELYIYTITKMVPTYIEILKN